MQRRTLIITALGVAAAVAALIVFVEFHLGRGRVAVYAFDERSGKLLWRGSAQLTQVNWITGGTSSITLHGAAVGQSTCKEHLVMVTMDANSGRQTGRVVGPSAGLRHIKHPWQAPTDAQLNHATSNGVTYQIHDGGPRFATLDAIDNRTQDLVWQRRMARGDGSPWWALQVGDGIAVISNGADVYAYDRARELWHQRTGHDQTGYTPGIGIIDGHVYVTYGAHDCPASPD